MFLIMFVFSSLPLWAAEVDFGVGLGMVRGWSYSHDPKPTFFRSEELRRTYFSPALELGLPLSDRLKLSSKIHYARREFQFNHYTSNGVNFNHSGYYLNVPLSLGIKLRRWELFSGADFSFLVHDKVTGRNFEDDEELKDAKAFVPSLHIGTRIPLDKEDRLGLQLMYSKDLLPFSEPWERQMSQNRFACHLVHRYSREHGTKPFLQNQHMAETAKSMLSNLEIGIAPGFSLAHISSKKEENLYDSIDYSRRHFSNMLELGYQIHPHLKVATAPYSSYRAYTHEYNPYTSARSLYLDLPVMLNTTVSGMEFFAGANLALKLRTRFKTDMHSGNNELPSDNKSFVPGICFGTAIPFKNNPRTAITALYTIDLLPFSEAYGIDKTHEKLSLNISYRFLKPTSTKDLISQDGVARELAKGSFEIGNRWFGNEDRYYNMPYLRFGTTKRLENGFGQGTMASLATLKVESDGALLAMLRAQIHKRVSYAWGIFELYVAPDLGSEIGLAADSGGSGPMSEGFAFPFINLMVGWETGMRVNIYRPVSLIAFAEKQTSLLYHGPLCFGLGLEYSPRPVLKQ